MPEQIIFNLQNHPTLRSEERLVNLTKGRECFVGLYILHIIRLCVSDCLCYSEAAVAVDGRTAGEGGEENGGPTPGGRHVAA